MSAAVVLRRFGGPEVLELTDVPTPTAADLGPDEVLVRVASAGVNVIDAMTRTGGGMAAAGVVTLPYTPGSDVAGTVEAVGSDVVDLTASQRVFGLIRFPAAGGTYAQHTVAPADHLIATMREALSNVARHSDADACVVEVEVDRDALVLRVADNGRGIHTTVTESGLRNMRGRALELGGTFQIQPDEPQGTVLEWRVPLAA